MTRRRKRAGDARFSTAEPDLQAYKTRLLRSPLAEASEIISRHEEAAWQKVEALGIDLSCRTPEAVRDSCEPDTEGRFLAEILYRARLARGALGEADNEAAASAALALYSLAVIESHWRREFRDGAAIIARRESVDGARGGGEARGAQMARDRVGWVQRALAIDATLSPASKKARAGRISRALAKEGVKRAAGTIEKVLPDRAQKPGR